MEATGAQQLEARLADPELTARSPPEQDQTSRLGDGHCVRAAAAKATAETCVGWCLDSQSFQTLAPLQCIFLNLLAVVTVVQCSRKFLR